MPRPLYYNVVHHVVDILADFTEGSNAESLQGSNPVHRYTDKVSIDILGMLLVLLQQRFHLLVTALTLILTASPYRVLHTATVLSSARTISVLGLLGTKHEVGNNSLSLTSGLNATDSLLWYEGAEEIEPFHFLVQS